MPLVHQLEQLPLAHHRVVQVQSRELGLLRRVLESRLTDQPLVDVAIVLELEGAEGVGDPLDGIRQPMGEVVERVDAPGVAAAIVRGVANPKQERIAHDHVRMGHVDLGPEHMRAVGKLARLHPAQDVAILLHGAIAEPARRPRRSDGAAMLADRGFGFAVDVRLTRVDQPHRDLVERLEIVARVELVVPLEAEPLDVPLDGIDIADVFGGRVGIVEPEVDLPAELSSDPEIEADRLGVPDVGKTVRLRGKPGPDWAAKSVRRHVLGDHLANEIPARRVLSHSMIRTGEGF